MPRDGTPTFAAYVLWMVTGSIVTGVSQLPLVCKELSVEQNEVDIETYVPGELHAGKNI